MKRVIYFFTYLFLWLPAVIWLPLFSDPLEFVKNITFVFLAIILLVLYVIQLVRSKEIHLTKDPITGGLLLLTLASGISLWFAPNKIAALFLPGGLATFLSLTVIFLLLTGPLSPSGNETSNRLTLFGTIGLLFASLISSSVALASYIFHFQSPLFLSGNPFATFTLLIISLSLVGSYIYFSFKSQHPHSSFMIISSSLLSVALGLTAVGLLIKLQPLKTNFAFLPYTAGWQIAADTLKSFPLWGKGPTNFFDAFTTSRPIDLNQNPTLWNFRFFVSSNTPFHLLTTIGLLGLFAYLVLVITVLRLLVKNCSRLGVLGKSISIALVITLLVQLLLPPTIVLWWAFFALLILFSLELKTLLPSPIKTTAIFTRQEEERFGFPLPTIITTIIAVLLAPVLYFGGRWVYADLTFKKAFDAAINNKGLDSYNFMLEAIKYNPSMESYHTTFSQLNLALANSIAASASNSTTKDATSSALTDQDRSNISLLVNQSVTEAKAAVALDPNNVASWENLTSIYKALISFAEGAGQWTIAAQKQVVILNPSDPTSRLALGAIYYSLGDYPNALLFFQQASDLKPDWPNAHYNLAATLRETKNYGEAINQMKQVLSLLSSGDPSLSQINGELADLQKAAQATISGQLKPAPSPSVPPVQTTLQLPEPLPTPIVSPPLELNPNSGPSTPAPTPTP